MYINGVIFKETDDTKENVRLYAQARGITTVEAVEELKASGVEASMFDLNLDLNFKDEEDTIIVGDFEDDFKNDSNNNKQDFSWKNLFSFNNKEDKTLNDVPKEDTGIFKLDEIKAPNEIFNINKDDENNKQQKNFFRTLQ